MRVFSAGSYQRQLREIAEHVAGCSKSMFRFYLSMARLTKRCAAFKPWAGVLIDRFYPRVEAHVVVDRSNPRRTNKDTVHCPLEGEQIHLAKNCPQLRLPESTFVGFRPPHRFRVQRMSIPSDASEDQLLSRNWNIVFLRGFVASHHFAIN